MKRALPKRKPTMPEISCEFMGHVNQIYEQNPDITMRQAVCQAKDEYPDAWEEYQTIRNHQGSTEPQNTNE